MAMRMVARYVPRRYSSSSGKILSEEEKAVENMYIMKSEQEKLERLAQKGPKVETNPATSTGGSVNDAKSSGSISSGSEKVSTNK